MSSRDYLEVVPNSQPSPKQLGSVARTLYDVFGKDDRLEFVVQRTAGPISFRFGIDAPTPTPKLKALAKELVKVLPDDYAFGVRTDDLPIFRKPGFVRWSAPTRIPHFKHVDERPLANLLEALIYTRRKFFYQVILQPENKAGKFMATPRLATGGTPTQAVVDAFTPSTFEGHRYGPAHGHGNAEPILRRIRTFNRTTHGFFEGNKTIQLTKSDIGHLVDFPVESPFTRRASHDTRPSDARSIPELFPSREAEFLHIDPGAIRAPNPLEELAHDLYRGSDALGNIEALYVYASDDASQHAGIYLRPQAGSLEDLCTHLSGICPEDPPTRTFTFDRSWLSAYAIDRYYVPESVDLRQQNIPRTVSNRLMRQFAAADRTGIVHLVAEPFRKDGQGFVSAIRVVRPADSSPLETDPLADLGLEIAHPESAAAIIEGTTDFPGAAPDSGHERIFFDPAAFAGLLLISPFWDAESYLPEDAADIDVETIPTIRSSVPPVKYDEPIVIDQHHRPDHIQYNPDSQEYVCTNCTSRYAAPLQTEGPRPLEAVFTCCSDGLEDVDMDAIRQPALAGVEESLAVEWGLPRAVIEFLILVSKAHAANLDPRWEYNYRDSMTDMRNFLGLEKAHIDDLRGENGAGTAVLRVHQSRKKFYELTAFGRQLTSHIRTRTEDDPQEYGDPAESIVHVTGQVTTEQFTGLLPGVETTATEIRVNDLVDTDSLPASIRSAFGSSAIDVVGYDANERPRYLLEFEVDGEHPTDTIRDARKMGIVATIHDIPMGFITPSQRVGKDIAEILQEYGDQQRGLETEEPDYLGDPAVLAETLDHPRKAAIVEIAKSIITADTPLSVILPLGHVIDSVLEAEDMHRALEHDEFHSLGAFLGVLYANLYKDVGVEDFLS